MRADVTLFAYGFWSGLSRKNSRPALGLVRHGRLSGLRLGRGQAAVTRSSPLRNTHASSGWQEVEFVRIYRIHTEALTSQFSSIQKIGSDDCAVARVGLTNLPRELGLNIDFVKLLSKATKTLHQDRMNFCARLLF